jgi:glycosyltransferase involved in cell wall biosynthesis
MTDLTILMPCLDEAETLAVCIGTAQAWAAGRPDVEVLVADNGSTDGPIAITESSGARVVHGTERGYGAALRPLPLDRKSPHIR